MTFWHVCCASIIQTEAERRRREAGVYMDRIGAQVMVVKVCICLYVFRGFLDTESTYRTESGTIW